MRCDAMPCHIHSIFRNVKYLRELKTKRKNKKEKRERKKAKNEKATICRGKVIETHMRTQSIQKADFALK